DRHDFDAAERMRNKVVEHREQNGDDNRDDNAERQQHHDYKKDRARLDLKTLQTGELRDEAVEPVHRPGYVEDRPRGQGSTDAQPTERCEERRCYSHNGPYSHTSDDQGMRPLVGTRRSPARLLVARST